MAPRGSLLGAPAPVREPAILRFPPRGQPVTADRGIARAIAAAEDRFHLDWADAEQAGRM